VATPLFQIRLIIILQKKNSDRRGVFRKEYFPFSINVGNHRKISLCTVPELILSLHLYGTNCGVGAKRLKKFEIVEAAPQK
jgi:hypothetical protein